MFLSKTEVAAMLGYSISRLNTLLLKNEIPLHRLAGYEHFHFHNLRASFISNLAIIGTPAKVIKELARHSDLKITSSHYLGDKDMNKNLLENWMKENRNID